MVSRVQGKDRGIVLGRAQGTIRVVVSCSRLGFKAVFSTALARWIEVLKCRKGRG